MNRSAILGGMILVALFGADAAAQGTLGELLDAGAKRLSKEQVQTIFSGAHVTGKTATGAEGEYEFKADGSYAGNVRSAQGESAGVVGTWTAADGGKLCVEWTLVGRGSRRSAGCGFYFVLADQYFLCESDSDRSALALKRTFRK